MSYVPELSLAWPSSLSFIPSLSSPSESQTESISFKGIISIYSAGWESAALLPHPCIPTSLRCPISLIFFNPSFLYSSGLHQACLRCSQPRPPSPFLWIREGLETLLSVTHLSTCIFSTGLLYQVLSCCLLIKGAFSFLIPSSQPLCIYKEHGFNIWCTIRVHVSSEWLDWVTQEEHYVMKPLHPASADIAPYDFSLKFHQSSLIPSALSTLPTEHP